MKNQLNQILDQTEKLRDMALKVDIIKKNYDFAGDFDLFGILKKISILISFQNESKGPNTLKMSERLKKDRKTVKEIIKTSARLRALLSSEPAENTDVVNLILDEFRGQSSFHQEFQIACNRFNQFKKELETAQNIFYDVLQIISSSPQELRCLPKFANESSSVYQTRLFESPYFTFNPALHLGRKNTSRGTIDIITALAFYYEKGTKLQAKLGWFDSPKIRIFLMESLPDNLDKNCFIYLTRPVEKLCYFKKISNTLIHIDIKKSSKDKIKNEMERKKNTFTHKQLTQLIGLDAHKITDQMHTTRGGKYGSDFYNFLSDLTPILNQLNIRLGPPGSMGKHIANILKQADFTFRMYPPSLVTLIEGNLFINNSNGDDNIK